MKHASLWALSLSLAMAASAQAADPVKDQAQVRDQVKTTEQAQERVYGSDLMTQKERVEYHNRMRALKTDQEREAFRMEHHKKMQERAQVQGKTLPDMPPAGMGAGQGMSQGIGQGQGMGPGKRR